MAKHKPLTKDQKYYQAMRNDPVRWEKRKAAQREYVRTHKKYRQYQRNYMLEYYYANKAELNEKRKGYADNTRNERVKRYWDKQKEKLSDKYIIKLLTRRLYRPEDITPAMVRKKRKEVKAFRKRKMANRNV